MTDRKRLKSYQGVPPLPEKIPPPPPPAEGGMMAEPRSQDAQFLDLLETCDMELGGAITALTGKLHKCKTQRDELLTLCETLFALADELAYEARHMEVLDEAEAAIAKSKGA